MRQFLHSSLVLLCFALASAHAVLVTFDSQSSTAAELNSVGSSKVTSGVSGGLSGTVGGQLDSQFTNSTMPLINGFAAGASNPVFTTSIYFRFQTPTSDAGGDMISLGLTNSAASNAFGTSPTRSMAGISKGSFSNSNFFPYYDSKVNGSGGGSSGGFGFSFVDGSWYQLSLDAVFNATNGRYSLRFNVTNSDSQGTLGSTIYTTTFSDNLALSNYAAAGVHPFVAFSGPVGQMGVGIVDNFVTIPEPSSIAAMLTGAIVILTRRTRTTPNGHPK